MRVTKKKKKKNEDFFFKLFLLYIFYTSIPPGGRCIKFSNCMPHVTPLTLIEIILF